MCLIFVIITRASKNDSFTNISSMGEYIHSQQLHKYTMEDEEV